MGDAATSNDMPKIVQLAIKLATEGPHKTLATPRLVQTLFNGVYVAKSTKAFFVWEHPYYPQFYLPQSAFERKYIKEGEPIYTSSDKKTPIGTQWTITVGNRSTSQAVAFASSLSGPGSALQGLVKLDFDAMDQWFEEDTPIFVHPKDPFKRIDILSSKRHIRVFIDDVCVADTHMAMHLYESMLPARFYLPLTAIDASVLRPSKTTTKCPYKGEAEYYSVEVKGKLHEDVVWYYNRPTLESGQIVGLCCFYNEKVDIELDGQMLERPNTHFGKAKVGEKPSIV